ncbi:MAG: T9SS type A sorting domain-containing protein [Bacteroidales bacterium]|nr:T9SS type A sorting domain-containing protein [Bacteroidales bacterium]
MKNLYKIQLIFCCFILLLGFSYSAGAQLQYSGGAGGGYASTSIGAGMHVTPADSLPTPTFGATVYPNPLSVNDVFKAKFTGVNDGETVSVVVSNLIGSRLFADDLEVSSETTINLPHERFSKGIYLITFTYKTSRITCRFSYMN